MKLKNTDLSKTKRILRLLAAKQRVSNGELARITPRYGARILNLRRDGYLITTVRENNDGLFTYSFKGHKDEQ